MRYVALVRGIGPSNPNMRNEHLRRVAEGLGLENVATVITTGNVVFDTETAGIPALEAALEQAWLRELGFESTTIIRAREDLEKLVDVDPFRGLEHGRQTYLLVTFAKGRIDVGFGLPYRPDERDYRIVAATDRELFTVTDTTSERTPDVMAFLERKFGRDITSRTWLSVARILKRMR